MDGCLRRARLRCAAIVFAGVLAAPSAGRTEESESLLWRTLDLLSATTALGMAAASDGVVALSSEIAKLDPGLREAAVPVLSAWIAQSRDAAVHEGVLPIPAEIRAQLEGYLPAEVLERARYRVGGGGVLSLQQTLFRSGYVPAVTLDHVIVFDRERDAREDAALWAHELKHVMQYARWGLDGFAARYIADYAGVEEEARDFRRAWADAVQRRRAAALGVPPPGETGSTVLAR